MERANLPTLLSPQNLPALARRAKVRYRIATTATDRLRIMAWPIFERLSKTVEVEFVTEREAPDITYHVEWHHQSIATARAEGAFWLLVPPDVAWSEGSFAHVADAIEAGKLAIAKPYLRVISESCLPEIAALGKRGDIIPIQSGDLVRIGVRHMHPLTSSAFVLGRHGRPSLEAIWRVPGEGVVFRHMVRELFAFDPTRITPTHLWYAGDGCTIGDFHIVTDSDDMFMLSFAPLLKETSLYNSNHAVTPMDLARQSLHPMNDTPLTSDFARRGARLHYGPMTEVPWQRLERRADAFIGRAIVMREALRIWTALSGRDCSQASRLISVALQSTALAKRWRHDGPVTVFVPNDAAFEQLETEASRSLLAREAASRLLRVALNHIVPVACEIPFRGQANYATLGGGKIRVDASPAGLRLNGHETQLVETIEVPPNRILIVDRWIVDEADIPVRAAAHCS